MHYCVHCFWFDVMTRTVILGTLITCQSLVAQELVDTVALRPEQLGFAFFQRQVDPASGFVIGGKNKTDDLKRLTSISGRSIRSLEASMRPGAADDGFVGSDAGFLGKSERLLDVLAKDNKFVVDERGLSHQELARPLLIIGYYAKKHAIANAVRLRHGNVDLLVRVQRFRGFQLSPFRDGTKTNIDVTIKRLSNGKELSYSLLVPHMIERYGFYEGIGTPYRVDPKAIIEVLDVKKAR